MNYNANKKLTHNSQKLRKDMTPEEKRLWYDFLKSLPLTVNRQKVIGDYIVDFFCSQAKLIIELDGSQHFEHENEERDKVRDTYLKNLGYTVVRYSNRDVNENFKYVCEDIYNRLKI